MVPIAKILRAGSWNIAESFKVGKYIYKNLGKKIIIYPRLAPLSGVPQTWKTYFHKLEETTQGNSARRKIK